MRHPAEELLNRIEEQGWKGGIVPVARLEELKGAIRDRHESGLLDPAFCRDRLSFFSFEPPADLPDAQSIVIIALPVPQTRITFHWQGLRLGAIVPPTYAGYSATTARVQAALACWLRAAGYAAAGARLPLKTLAACSGLAEYGRNNLCYVLGMGSFLQLAASFSDLPCPADPWREPMSLDRCQSVPPACGTARPGPFHGTVSCCMPKTVSPITTSHPRNFPTGSSHPGTTA